MGEAARGGEARRAAAVRRLDDRLVDKIAAGEVVERPASVVKELVENALDAGASWITVTTEAAGTALIRVADDGHGIRADELALAVERHCTSKLATAADLAAIRTMGFRGEALPSIGAVARLTLTTRHTDDDGGAAITVDGGRAGPVRPASRATGTTVEVRDLFHATPARLKFMKSEGAEAAAVADTVRRIALSAPHVAFTLVQNGRTREWAAGSADERVRDVLGAPFGDEAIHLAAERDGLRLTGRLGRPTEGRATAQDTHAFVNGRVVRDRLVGQAIRAGYQDVLARDRHPMAVVWIAVDPAAVDVNVHPAKSDVRFRDAQAVRGAIVSSIRRALASAAPRGARSIAEAAVSALARSAFSPSRDVPEGLAEAAAPFVHTRPSTARVVPLRPRPSPELPPAARAPSLTSAEDAAFPLGAAVAQVHGNYIVAQTEDGLVLVDQHAGHERIVYEALKAAAASRTPPSQGLLIPEVVELAAEDVDQLAAEAERLAAFGLVLEPFGPGAVVVRATPAVLGTFDVARLVRTLADEVAAWGASEAVQARLDRVAATLACHGSVRSGRALKVDEMNALLRRIEATPSGGECNHGRPTFVSLSLADIERLFARR
ncbi:DNA mismatch repair endonuclease MutL [Acuticoccus sp.]|uniref:DNA mismatch repair endonuclease MutL n=1 Tax=Acuticoccus sp. TaxID=1904378 RepID=UPI003B51E87C